MYFQVTQDAVSFVIPLAEWERVPEAERTPYIPAAWLAEFAKPAKLEPVKFRSVEERLRPVWEAFARATDWLLKNEAQ